MKTYTEELEVDVPAAIAWESLTRMNVWLKRLSTNKDVTYANDQMPFCVSGRTYVVTTKGGLEMNSVLTEVNPQELTVRIKAEHKPLVSCLSCKVVPLSDSRVKLIRTQSYPGVFGAIFTLFYNRRESTETSEYLEVWAADARELLSKQRVS